MVLFTAQQMLQEYNLTRSFQNLVSFIHVQKSTKYFIYKSACFYSINMFFEKNLQNLLCTYSEILDSS